jgi:tRNA A37 threonylcarbamoyladenosine dehydratase
MRYARSRPLFGDDFEKLQHAKVLLLGVGGVGGICLDCLIRSGVGDITIVDFDTFEESNQNRQLGSEAVGEVKVAYFKKCYPSITVIHEKVTPQWCEVFDFSPYDLVIDAIDDMPAKVALSHIVGEKMIASMGGAKRLDPTKIEIASIWKTHGDALAKKFRYELKKSGFKGKFDVVFSSEPPQCKELGSFMGVTGSFGFTLCALAIRKLRA